jgi:hypothetical protein
MGKIFPEHATFRVRLLLVRAAWACFNIAPSFQIKRASCSQLPFQPLLISPDFDECPLLFPISTNMPTHFSLVLGLEVAQHASTPLISQLEAVFCIDFRTLFHIVLETYHSFLFYELLLAFSLPLTPRGVAAGEPCLSGAVDMSSPIYFHRNPRFLFSLSGTWDGRGRLIVPSNQFTRFWSDGAGNSDHSSNRLPGEPDYRNGFDFK